MEDYDLYEIEEDEDDIEDERIEDTPEDPGLAS